MERKDTERIIRLTRVTPIDDKARAGCRGIQREAWLLTRLALTLMSYLGTSTRWMMMCARLIAFVIFLFPAFMRMMYWFIRSVQNGSVLRSIRYGRNARNLLDIYRPSTIMHQKGSNEHKVPVVVFVSGGAWTIGYKGWGGLMGRIIMQHGIMFVCVDYRNFPQGTMSCMLEDIDNAMSWIFANISEYGGDTNRIYLVGQSAGAQLTCMTLLNQVRRGYDINRCLAASPSSLSSSSSNSDTSTDDNDDDMMDSSNGGTDPNGVFPPLTPRYTPPAAAPSTPLSISSMSSTTITSMMSHYRWRASDLRGYIGISGPYDLVTFIDQLEKRGINRRLFTSIVGGDEQLLALYSPSRILHDLRILAPSNDVEGNSGGVLLGTAEALSPRSPSSSPSSLLFEASSMAASFDPPTIATITSSPSDNENDKSLDNHRLFYALPEVVCLFPPMQLYHGSKDVSVPLSSSQFLYESLRQCGIPCTLTCYNGKSHTDPILEDPMSGNDPLLTDLITTINGQSTSTITSCHRLVNAWAISAARFVNPF